MHLRLAQSRSEGEVLPEQDQVGRAAEGEVVQDAKKLALIIQALSIENSLPAFFNP